MYLIWQISFDSVLASCYDATVGILNVSVYTILNTLQALLTLFPAVPVALLTLFTLH